MPVRMPGSSVREVRGNRFYDGHSASLLHSNYWGIHAMIVSVALSLFDKGRHPGVVPTMATGASYEHWSSD